MYYVQHRLLGAYHTGAVKYPTNIKHWHNVPAIGDITSLNKIFQNDFAEMIKPGIIDDIQDHCKDIYNFSYRRIHQITIGAMTVESFFVMVEIIDVYTVILDVVNDARLNHFSKIILKYFVE